MSLTNSYFLHIPTLLLSVLRVSVHQLREISGQLAITFNMDALDDMFIIAIIIVQHNCCKIFIFMQFVDNKILGKQHIFTTLCFQS